MTTNSTLGDGASFSLEAPVSWLHGRLARWLGARFLPIIVLLVTGIACAIPVFFVFRQAFTSGVSHLTSTITDHEFLNAIGNTLILSVGTVIVAAVLGTLLAWFAHCLPPNRRWLGVLPLFPLVMPALAGVTGYIFLLSPRAGFINWYLRDIPPFRGDDSGPFDIMTMPWMVLVSGLLYSTFMFLFVRSSMSQLQQDFIDAASASGAGPVRIFLRVVVPLIRPGLVFGVLTVAILSLGQFAVPLLLGEQGRIDVLTTAMFNKLNNFPSDYPAAATYGIPILIVGLLFILLQKALLRDGSRFETTTGKGGGRPLTSNGPIAQGILVLYGVVTVLLPLLALVVVTLEPFWSPQIHPSEFGLQNYRAALFHSGDAGGGDVLGAIRNSLVFAAFTVLVTLPLGFLCARTIYHRRQHRIISVVQEIVITLPLGVPAVIIGTGFLLAFIKSPIGLYGTPASMVITYSVIMLPFVTRMQLAALTNLGTSLIDAATVHGAGWLRRAIRVELPLIRPALGAAAALSIVLISHEFSASVIVRSQKTQVMGTVLYDLYTFGTYGQAAVMALVMFVVTLIGVVIALFLGGTSALGKVEGPGA